MQINKLGLGHLITPDIFFFFSPNHLRGVASYLDTFLFLAGVDLAWNI